MINRSICMMSSALILLVMTVTPILAQTTSFTYQGKLMDGSSPANGSYDIQFKLFDVPTVGAGSQQGLTIANPSVQVTAGIFTVQLDFGLAAFGGSPRFLEIAVRGSGSPNPYTLLSPRQSVTSSPYSIRSLNSSVADGLSSACVGCVTSVQVGSVSGSAVTGAIPVSSVPPGSANYVQNTTVQQSDSSFNISGDGVVGGTLSAIAVNTVTDYQINGARILSNAGLSNTILGVSAGNSNLGSDNTIVGRNAGFLNVGGSFNAIFGASAHQSNVSGGNNSIFGYFAGPSNTGSYNSFFGRLAGQSNITGSHNTLIGETANVGLSNLMFATAIGSGAVVDNSNSVVLGRTADTVRVPGKLNVAGNLNVTGTIESGIQYSIDGNRVLSAPGGNNLFVGGGAGDNFSSGNYNVFVGGSAGFNSVTSTGNAFFGTFAGLSNTSGTFNTIVGRSADVGSGNLTFATAIGANSLVSTSNTIALGRSDGSDLVQIYGRLQLDTLGPATNPVCFNGANRIGTCSSSLRYKHQVRAFHGGVDIIRRLRPISFTWDEDGQPDLGLGAEEVARIEPLLTFRNKHGEIEGVRYNQLTAVLVNSVKQQQQQIDSQRRILEQQQRQIASLKQLVCSRHQHSKPCRKVR